MSEASSAQQPRDGNVADYRFAFEGAEPDVFRVTQIEGHDQISHLFDYHVSLVCPDTTEAPEKTVGEAVVLEISGKSGTRQIAGIVREWNYEGVGRNVCYYSARIVPPHWLLTHRFGSRIFQSHVCEDMTVPGIVKKVLSDASFPDTALRVACSGTYQAREYVVQYRETEMDFVSRMLEEEGIFYYFEHTENGCVMVLGDATASCTASELHPDALFKDPDGLQARDEVVYAVQERKRLAFGSVQLTDYDFKKPETNLGSSAAASEFSALEYRDYPGRYIDPAVGKRLASTRLEEAQATTRVLNMTSQLRGLETGTIFNLANHPLETVNDDYLVVGLRISAKQPQAIEEETGSSQDTTCRVQIEVIPKSVVYRPQRRTPKPIISGAQTAVVVGEKSEEIYTDAYGRIKVHFRWDRYGERDENASCWIRVRQNAAGGSYGALFLPRVGHEVVVEFLEGDPDRPLVTGVVYNNDLMPPYKLPDERTKTTIKSNTSKGGEGFNEIRFEDAKDKEQLFIHAQKDQDNRVLNDDKQWVGNDQHKIIKRDLLEHVDRHVHRVVKGDIKIDQAGIVEENVEGDRMTNIGGDDHLTVAGAGHIEIAGDLNKKIGGAKNDQVTGKSSLTVDSDYHVSVGGNYAVECGGDFYVNAGGNLVLEAGGKLTIKVGSNFVTVDASGVAIKGSMVYLNSQGSPASGSAANAKAPGKPTKPQKPEKAVEADKADPGKDMTRTVSTLSPQAVVLRQAAVEGAPFCEECEQIAQQQAAEDDAAFSESSSAAGQSTAPTASSTSAPRQEL